MLDDTVIFSFLRTLCNNLRDKRYSVIDPLHLSQFLDCSSDASQIHRHISNVSDLCDCDIALFPLNKNLHWSLITADLTQYPTVTLLHEDPLNNYHHKKSTHFLAIVKQLLIEHWRWRTDHNRRPNRPCPETWTLQVVPSTHIPQQNDSISCGVICTWYAMARALGIPQLLLTYAHIPRLRNHIAHCLMYNHFPLPTIVSNSTDVCNDLDHLQQSYKFHISQCEAYGKIGDTSKLDHTLSQQASDDRGHDLTTAIILSDDSVPSLPSPSPTITNLKSPFGTITMVPIPPADRCQFPSAVLPSRAQSQYSLLIGMLYTHPSQRHHKFQHLRDGVRCESLEKNE